MQNELLHHHYIKLRLTGEGMNTKAYGAKIEITTPDGIHAIPGIISCAWLSINSYTGYFIWRISTTQ